MDAAAQNRAQSQDRSPIIDVANGDPEMATAIGKARATLPAFWASYESPKSSESGHSLKVRFPTGGSKGEHIWMAEVKKLTGGRYSGRFANQPRDLPGKRAGDLVQFTEADITDWMFMRGGKIVGGETIRPMLKRMPRADADALRAQLEVP
ncbi:YegJ family protein [Bradyrhizobium sp.]|uniref:YegJ family protein n=1 Tax=Bradyrhizobium sp. TaxID=376 RepID=UPI0040380659